MFSFKRLWLALPFVGLLASCTEEIEVAAPYQPVTVIYGLLDINDTAQYIRVQKAFLDENKSALSMAQNPDSNFYGNLTVRFLDYNTVSAQGMNAGTLVGEEVLNRVDLAGEGFAKAEGPFFRTPNYAYKTKRTLLATHMYRLIVSNSATGVSDTAETSVIGNDMLVYEFTPMLQLAFPAIRNQDNFSLTVRPPDSAFMFEGIVRFHYVDKEGNSQTDRSFDYRFASNTRNASAAPNSSVELRVAQRSFYGAIREAMGTAGTNVQRYMDSCDVIVWAGGKALLDYQTVNNAQGGITADQIRPIYTNIRGKNVYGLFSTRTRVVRNRTPITQQTMDSLMNSPTMAAQNIRGRSDH